MSRFDSAAFANPANEYRPLQIVHGFDHVVRDQQAPGEWDPGQYAIRLQGAVPEGSTVNAAAGAEIGRYLDQLTALGLGGVVANVGFKDYLQSPYQWALFRYGMKAAAARGLRLWWYDEKGYPSGTAGGIVTRANPEFVARGLACYPLTVTGPLDVRFDLPVSCRRWVWAGAVAGDVSQAAPDRITDLGPQVDGQGTLRWSAPPGAWTILYLAERVAYEGTHSAANVCEFKHFVNLLEPAATAAFLRVTHEQYYRETPPDLWRQMRAVFTDEPSFMTAYAGELPERYRDQVPVVDLPLFRDRPPAVPWSDGLPRAFQARWGYPLQPWLFALFCSETAAAQAFRQQFYEVLTAVYAEAFYGQILTWCQAHGIASSGHVLAEEWLPAHVAYHGSLFAVIRKMDLPGIDMLDSNPAGMLNGLGFMTAKQVSSVAHLTGAKEVHSECSDWCQRNAGVGATLPERCGQGNLLYVLGINQVTAYWGWSDIGADAYRAYNDYMGRLALLLRGGRHVCDVAVLYPVRAAWALFTPTSPQPALSLPNQGLQGQLDGLARHYADVVRDLLRQQLDLDIVDEEAILEARITDGRLAVADERYAIVVVPPMATFSAAVAEKLAAFGQAGGRVIGAEAAPSCAETPASTERLARAWQTLLNGGGQVVSLAEVPAAVRRAGADDLTLAEPQPGVLYTHRQLEGRDLYFVINNTAAAVTVQPRLRVPGPYVAYRPLTGQQADAGAAPVLELAPYEGVFLVTPPVPPS